MRGQIKNIARKQQINDFSGLLFGNITPTDLDGVIEYRDKAYVFYETKYMDAELPRGQRVCLERFVNDMQKAGKYAIAIIVQHETHDTAQSVSVASSRVREFYFKPTDGWVLPKKDYSALEITQRFLNHVDSSDIGA